MNVLITGGTGVIGSYIIRELLSTKYKITVFGRKPSDFHNTYFKHLKFIGGDVCNSEQLKKSLKRIDAVIHLAAITPSGRKTAEELYSVNVLGTLNVLEAAVAAGIKKVIFASSAAASGFSFQKHDITPKYLPIDESHPSEPQDEYGLSKLLSETACRSYTDAYNIQTICLRINHNWCTSLDGSEIAINTGLYKGLSLEELWYKRYYKSIEEPDGEWPVPGPPKPQKLLWSYTDIRDAARSFRLALENEKIKHEVFYINGFDTCSNIKTMDLVNKYFKNIKLKKEFNDYDTLISYKKAEKLLGYKPLYTWRKSDFYNWYLDKTKK